MSNSFANPIIYSFTNESFRADLVTLFYMWFPCCVFLTKMIPRSPSSSTYESVVFRRNNCIRQGTKVQLVTTTKDNRKFLKQVDGENSEYIELRDSNSLRGSFHNSSSRSNRDEIISTRYPVKTRTREVGESIKLLTSCEVKMNGTPPCAHTANEFG
ncbi:hypothetical protein ScPMuIL_004876 [Solemya velum]